MKHTVIVHNESVNSSLGFDISAISACLNDSQLNNSGIMTLSAIENILDVENNVENGVHSNSQDDKRSKRNINKKDYSESASNDADISCLSEDDDVADPNFCPNIKSGSINDSDDSYSDAENPYVPKTKKPRMEKNSDIILQSTPKKRGRGLPKGAKNKKVSGANKKGIGHKIQKKQTSSRKNGKGINSQKGGESTGDSNEADDTNLVDDKENNPNPKLIENFRTYGTSEGEKSTSKGETSTSKGETGCNSPVKKKVKCESKIRKKIRDPQNWVKNKRKLARNSGQTYSYWCKRGQKTITNKEAKIGPDCGCKQECMKKLNTKNLNIILTLFDKFWKMADFNLQRAYLIKQSNRTPSQAEVRLGKHNPARNGYRSTYFVTYESENYPVCRKAFAAIHGVDLSRVDYLGKVRDVTNTAKLDQRGKHKNRNTIANEITDVIHKFIQSLPVRSSHYTREVNQYRQYMDYRNKMSIPEIYRMYLDYSRCNYPLVGTVKESFFRHIWNTCYNINTEPPKVDVCNLCNIFDNRIKEAVAANKSSDDIQQEKEAHQHKASTAYENLRMAKDTGLWSTDEWITICIDLQQTHTIPKSPVGPHYYLRKLNVYNFSVHELQTNEPHFYVWPEYNGSKGAAEIYSCIYKYLKENVFCKEKYPMKLRIMADNCGGQNKNHKLVLALMRLVHLGMLDRIELAFMVSGHSYLPCDQGFATISNKLKKIETIPSQAQLMNHMREARNKPYKVYNLERNEIFNLDVFTEKDKDKRVALIRTIKDIPKAFSTASIIVIAANTKNGYKLKKSFDETDHQAAFVKVQLPHTTDDLNLGTVELELKYPKQIKLNSDKMDDLKSMRDNLSEGGRWIEELDETQKQDGLCQQVEDDVESHFDKETWGANNNLVREKVKKVPIEHALINDHKPKKKHRKDKKIGLK